MPRVRIGEIGYWLIIVGLGWALLLDSLTLLNIDFPRWLRSSATQKALTTGAVLVPLVLIFPGFSESSF